MIGQHSENNVNSKIKAHILMILLVMTWGFDYVVAKFGMYDMTPTSLLFARFFLGAIIIGIIKLVTRNYFFLRKKDIPVLIACVIFGEIMYYECEYNAMSYLPVALITIVLAFVPAISVIIERIVFKRRANSRIIIGIIFCIIGIAFVIGSDFSIIFQGRIIGYLLAFGAVLSWNFYNFLTASLEEYDPVSLAFLQLLGSSILLAPVALHNMLPLSQWTPGLWCIVLYMGIISSAIGYIIVVNALKVIGPTPSAVYSDFMPVSTAICGAIFLHESLTPIQIIGGIIVVAAGYVVIREKGKLDEQRQGL